MSVLHPGVATEYHIMTVEPRLVSLLETGEQTSLLPPDATRNDNLGLDFASSDPTVAAIDAGGNITAQTPGTTTITIAKSGQTLREMPLSVIDPPADAPTLAPEHPRLRFSASAVENRRALIARLRKDSNHAFHDDVVAFFANADSLADETVLLYERDISGDFRRHELPIPVAQPEPMRQPRSFTDYPFWTMLSRQIERRMTTLSAAWTLTGERKYADKAKAQLLGLAQWAKWHEYDKATNNLSLPHFTMGASIAYDELFDVMSEEERALVRSAIVNLGMRPMSHWHKSEFDHNINVLMNAGMLMGYLAVGDEEPHLGKYYHAPIGVLQWYLNERATSTVTEGHAYTSYAVGTILPVAAAVRNATGESDLYASPFIREELLDFFAYFRGGTGGFANLSDSRLLESDPVAIAMHLFHEFDDPRAAWLLGHSQADRSNLVPLLRETTPTAPPATLDLPRSRHFARFDWIAMRSGWSDDDALIAFVSSPSDAGHNHYDQNHFIVNIGGEWLVTDPGYQNYTPGPEADFTLGTLGHNALLVNGNGQSLRGNGRVIASELGEQFDYVVGDATAAYDGRLRRWHRHAVFSPTGGYLLLIDDVETISADDRVEFLFHTLSDVLHDNKTMEIGAEVSREGSFTFSGEEHGVRLAFGARDGVVIHHRQHPGAEMHGTWLALESVTSGSTIIVSRIDLDPSPDTPGDFAFTIDNDRVGVTVTHATGTDGHQFTLGDSPTWTHSIPGYVAGK